MPYAIFYSWSVEVLHTKVRHSNQDFERHTTNIALRRLNHITSVSRLGQGLFAISSTNTEQKFLISDSFQF